MRFRIYEAEVNKLDMMGRYIRELDSNLTLKSDYSEELETLSNLENNVVVLRHLGASRQKANDLISEIRRIREWINQEMGEKT